MIHISINSMQAKNRRALIDPNQMINIAVIVLMGYIAIILLANIQSVSSCASITSTTLQNACNQFFNNAGVLFTLAAVLLLLLVIPHEVCGSTFQENYTWSNRRERVKLLVCKIH